MINVKIKKLDENALLPTYGTEHSAALDIHSIEDIIIAPGEVRLVKTGLAIAPPEGYHGFVFPRSGTATKRQLNLINCVGVIDEDYRGELKVPIHNTGSVHRHILVGDRIAQILFLEIDRVDIECVDELPETKRGNGGFGSTGK